LLGNLIPSKGPGDLLRAAPAVLQSHPRTRFVFAGAWRDAAFERWVDAFLDEHGLRDRVEFTGPVDRARKVELLREADLLVFPTYYKAEGHPWVIVEALAAGLPIVSTDRGCIRECVDGNGRLVPPRDADGLARVLTELLRQPAELERMAVASRDLHRRRFTRAHFRRGLFRAMRAAGGERVRGVDAREEVACA
jgi:glycosyltransferase involved in cell wall biosynthesis